MANKYDGIIIKFGILIISMLALSCCGIEIIPVLYPPENPENPLPGETQFTFQHETDNGANFIGYNIYYKFYCTEDLENNKYSDDRSAVLAVNSSWVDVLKGRGYRQMVSLINDEPEELTSDPNKTNIPVSEEIRSINFVISLDFATTPYPTITHTYLEDPITLCRYSNAMDRVFEGFLYSDLDIEDEDISAMLPEDISELPQTLYLALAVIATGLTDQFTQIDSKPMFFYESSDDLFEISSLYE